MPNLTLLLNPKTKASMKKIVLTYGTINAVIMVCMFTISAIFRKEIGYGNGMYIGFANIILGVCMIYFAIASHKKNNDGLINFGKAFSIGLYVALIGAVTYVLIWIILRNTVLINFSDENVTYLQDKLQKNGASAAEVAKQTDDMKMMAQSMKNHISLFMKYFPVGLLISLMSASILCTKKKKIATT